MQYNNPAGMERFLKRNPALVTQENLDLLRANLECTPAKFRERKLSYLNRAATRAGIPEGDGIRANLATLKRGLRAFANVLEQVLEHSK